MSKSTLKSLFSAFNHFLLLVFSLASFNLFAKNNSQIEKVLICGVCKNIGPAVFNTIKNIELLGNQFADYSVIIYENNSSDKTSFVLSQWAKINKKVTFISEKIPAHKLAPTRIENISNARNIVLSLARDPKFFEYKYLIWADLDFEKPWPINEIVKTIESPVEWDCVSANGIRNRSYYDRYAFRNETYPFGPELLGDDYFWPELWKSWFSISDADNWIPVFSAFGGLAIYKTQSILNFYYSAHPTEDLKNYYQQILHSISLTNSHLQRYLSLMNMNINDLSHVPIEFQLDDQNNSGVCCEHLPIHASMALHGYGKFYINPKMIMHYD